jgi:hypothetical protein
MMPMAIQSCQHVSIAGQSHSLKKRPDAGGLASEKVQDPDLCGPGWSGYVRYVAIAVGGERQLRQQFER